MTHGEVAAKVIEQHVARRWELPAPFRNLGYLHPSLEIFSRAYNELNEDRKRDDNPEGPRQLYRITREQVTAWLVWYGWQDDIDFKTTLWEVVKACDSVYIEIEGAKIVKRLKQQQRRQAMADKRAAGKQQRGR